MLAFVIISTNMFNVSKGANLLIYNDSCRGNGIAMCIKRIFATITKICTNLLGLRVGRKTPALAIWVQNGTTNTAWYC